MNILIIDARGGGIGKALVSALRQNIAEAEITAVGSNSIAAAAMKKAGAHYTAVGENAVIVACRTADIIAGPIGIVIADSMLGEITPAMAVAVGQSSAKRVLIPTTQCGNIIAGAKETNLSTLIQSAVGEIKKLMQNP